MNELPALPPHAAPWVVERIIGRPSIEAAWAGCFQAGHALGVVQASLIAVAVVAGLALVASLVTIPLLLFRHRGNP